MIKKILAITVLTCIIFSMVVLPAHAATSGTCGNEISWTLDDDGTLTLSGTGYTLDYEFKTSPWYENSSVKNVIIGSGITRIGQYAFSGCTGMTSVTIPDSVTYILEKAHFIPAQILKQ